MKPSGDRGGGDGDAGGAGNQLDLVEFPAGLCRRRTLLQAVSILLALFAFPFQVPVGDGMSGDIRHVRADVSVVGSTQNRSSPCDVSELDAPPLKENFPYRSASPCFNPGPDGGVWLCSRSNLLMFLCVSAERGCVV